MRKPPKQSRGAFNTVCELKRQKGKLEKEIRIIRVMQKLLK